MSLSTPANRYGPHDPTTCPDTGRRFGPGHRPGKRTDVELIPLAPVLIRQRAQINGLARGDELVGLRGELCGICSRPEWQCLSMRRGDDDPHAYEPPARVR